MRSAVLIIGLACFVLGSCASTIDGTAAAAASTKASTGNANSDSHNSGDPAGTDPTSGNPASTAPGGSTTGQVGAATTQQGPSTDGGSSPGTQTSSSVLGTSSSVQLSIPQEYAAFGYFGYRGVSADAVCPQEIPDCVGIEVYSVNGCPAGATVLLDYFKEESNPTTFFAEGTGSTPPIVAGGTQVVFIAIPADIVGDNPYGYIKDISC